MSNSTKFSILDVVTASVCVDKKLGYIKEKNKVVMAELLSGETAGDITENVEPEEVIELLDWGREQKGSDFYRSLRDILSQSEITASQFGFVACLPMLKRMAEGRDEQRKELEKTTASSEWIGTERKRGEFFVKLTGKRYLNNYGSYLYNVVTRDGNLGVFFNQNELEVKEGECFIMKATPKRHQVSKYHGGKETMFNRVVVKEVVGRKETA
jgi:hypothetical protein